MSDTNTAPAPILLTRPPGAEPRPDPRARLRQALDNLHEDQQRHAALEEARERARRSRWAHQTEVEEAEAAIEEASRDDSARLAYDFANSTTSPSPVKALQVRRDAAQANADRIGQIAAAIDRELEQLQHRLRDRRVRLNEALANLVCNSDAFHSLHAQLDACWSRMRGLKLAFSIISKACEGQMPQADLNRWQRSESLNHEAINIPVDKELAAAWSAALARLLEDPEPPLPDGDAS